jgi:enoyl-CoA hydratase/carnithine racemase
MDMRMVFPKRRSLSGHFFSTSLRNGKVWLTFSMQGGGFKAILNADVIFASPNSTFALPEVLRGVSALAGALPRAMLFFGNHRTMDLILTGRRMPVEEALNWGLVKEIVPQEK